jgi:ribosome-binding protein aMBF1 (putative translation factor)
MSGQESWKVVSNKKTKPSTVIPLQNKYIDPIISRQRETQAKLEADKQASKQIKYEEQKDLNQDWNYISFNKPTPKPKPQSTIPQREASAIKENADGDIKIKKVSKSMAKAIVDARVARKWTQLQLALNSAIDIKSIGEIERSGCVYNANVFNKLCKTLGINVERNIDFV